MKPHLSLWALPVKPGPLHFVLRQPFSRAVIELGRARALVRRHFLRVLASDDRDLGFHHPYVRFNKSVELLHRQSVERILTPIRGDRYLSSRPKDVRVRPRRLQGAAMPARRSRGR